ncbi:MAG: hypothetical protein ACRDSI_20195 [Pseudonocardiaceae bacterium]
MKFGTRASRHRLRRAVFGPVPVTGALAVLAVVAAVPPALREGWMLPWLLLGLTAGYALSGSA